MLHNFTLLVYALNKSFVAYYYNCHSRPDFLHIMYHCILYNNIQLYMMWIMPINYIIIILYYIFLGLQGEIYTCIHKIFIMDDFDY